MCKEYVLWNSFELLWSWEKNSILYSEHVEPPVKLASNNYWSISLRSLWSFGVKYVKVPHRLNCSCVKNNCAQCLKYTKMNHDSIHGWSLVCSSDELLTVHRLMSSLNFVPLTVTSIIFWGFPIVNYHREIRIFTNFVSFCFYLIFLLTFRLFLLKFISLALPRFALLASLSL